MHRIASFTAVVAATGMLAPPAAAAFTEADVHTWIGTGENTAVLVIDWQSGPESSLAWGYRFDGTTTGRDMLMDIIAGDSRLHLFTDGPGGPLAMFGLGYDVNGNGFDRVTDPTPGNGSDDGYAADPEDLYFEGWFDGYWAYWVNQTLGDVETIIDPVFGDYDMITSVYDVPQDTVNPYAEQWQTGLLGAAERIIVDGSWDGYSAARGFAVVPPAQPIPSPSALAVMAVAGGLVTLRRGSRASRASRTTR